MSDGARRARASRDGAGRSPARALLRIVAVTLAIAVVAYALAFGIADRFRDGSGVLVYGLGILVACAGGWRAAGGGRVRGFAGALIGAVVAVALAVAVTIVAFLAAPCPGSGC